MSQNLQCQNVENLGSLLISSTVYEIPRVGILGIVIYDTLGCDLRF